MLDLFGDNITAPQTKPAKGALNAARGFPEFWAAWPTGPRKVGKQQALNKWATTGCAEYAVHICQHVEWLKTQDDWIKGFIPMPTTYLNQQRWVDWTVPAPVAPRIDVLAQLKAHKGAAMPAHVRQRIAELRQGAH